MRVQVDGKLVSKDITTKDGREMTLHSQRAKLLFGGDGMMDRPFSLAVEKPGAELPSGFYTIDPSSFENGDYDKLAFSRDFSLIPEKAKS